MTGLLTSELRRISSRRLFRWIAVLMVALVLGLGVYRFFSSNPDPAAALAVAEEQVRQCEADRQRFAAEDGPEAVEDWTCPRAHEIAPFYDRGFRYVSEVHSATRGVGTFLLVLGFMLGASFAGAEWGSGSMTTLLTFEPRRHRVLAAKLAVCGPCVAMGTFAILVLLAVLHLPAGYLRGYTDGLGTSWWSTSLATWGRTGVLAGIFAMVAVAVAVAIRHTAGAVAVGGVYAAIVDPLLVVWRQGALREWLLIHNVPRFQGYAVAEVVREEFGGTSTSFEVLPIWRSAVLLSVYTVVIVILAYVSFARRDVT